MTLPVTLPENVLTVTSARRYPFSTSHVEDFGNLLSVYCDAVFNPLLTYNDFRQEGLSAYSCLRYIVLYLGTCNEQGTVWNTKSGTARSRQYRSRVSCTTR